MSEITQEEACCGCYVAQAAWRADWASDLQEAEEQADPLADVPNMALVHWLPQKMELSSLWRGDSKAWVAQAQIWLSFMGSQDNSWGWQGPLLRAETATAGIKSGLEYLQSWRHHNVSGQPLSLLNHLHSKNNLVPTEFPLFWFVSIDSCPVTKHCWGDSGPAFFYSTIRYLRTWIRLASP